MGKNVLAWQQADGWLDKFLIRVPPDVEYTLAVTKESTRIADNLAILDPEANRRILREVARLLGVADILAEPRRQPTVELLARGVKD